MRRAFGCRCSVALSLHRGWGNDRNDSVRDKGRSLLASSIWLSCGLRPTEAGAIAVDPARAGNLLWEAVALECHFLGKKGQFNLSQIEHLGVAPNLGTQRKDGDVLSLHFQKMDQEQAGRLKDLLAEHLSGFREDFATGE